MTDKKSFNSFIKHFKQYHLINDDKIIEILSMFDSDFPFSSALEIAESIHIHIKVEDISLLPHPEIKKLGGKPENQKEGYIKYSFSHGINMIFSSIPIAKEDLISHLTNTTGVIKKSKPFVDHVGIDIRLESEANSNVFKKLPCIGKNAEWAHVPQGEAGNGVHCCHVEVSYKHWFFPPKSSKWTRPIEIAYGKLKINEKAMGCDLRPMDPACQACEKAEKQNLCTLK